MNNKVIYTCLVGSYDHILQPEIVYDDFDYICYSNDIVESHIGVWRIEPIPFESNDKTRLSRYVKINPHKVLTSYDYSIYIDANIVIVDTYLRDKVLELIKQNVIWAQIKHTFINCIYDEIIKCAELAKDRISVLSAQYNFLKKEGYPTNYGLYENGLLFRKHKDTEVIKISEAWWNNYMTLSRRDQHCLCYVFWMFRFEPELLLPKGQDTRNHLGFIYKEHTMSLKKKIVYKLKIYRNQIIIFLFKSKLFN